MNPTNPPRIVTWMMEHLAPADRDEAIAGDLLEHFRAGRSSGWYWRQAVNAIVMEWIRSAWRLRAALLFAAIWSLLSPAWELAVGRFYRHNPFMGNIWRLPFPLSIACDFVLRVAVDMFFIWFGVLVYVVLCRIALGKFALRRPWIALLASLLAYALGFLGMIAAGIFITAHSQRQMVGGETFTLISITENFRIWELMFVRLQYFAAIAMALWFLRPKVETPARLAA